MELSCCPGMQWFRIGCLTPRKPIIRASCAVPVARILPYSFIQKYAEYSSYVRANMRHIQGKFRERTYGLPLTEAPFIPGTFRNEKSEVEKRNRLIASTFCSIKQGRISSILNCIFSNEDETDKAVGQGRITNHFGRPILRAVWLSPRSFLTK